MPPIIVSVFRFLPWALVALLVVINVWVLVLSPTATLDENGVWVGEPLSGKPLALSELALSAVVEEISSGDKTKGIVGQPSAAEVGADKPMTIAQVLSSGVSSKLKTVESNVPARETGFIVQAGSFVIDVGVETLMARLREYGWDPRLESVIEPIRLNDVQAGPFKELEDAREAEAKFKAACLAVIVEETGEGFIISLSQTPLLGYAVQDLDRAKYLGVKTMRVVKISVDRPVKKVLLGPFPTKGEAKLVSARVAKLGLAIPVIREWTAPLVPSQPEASQAEKPSSPVD